MAKRRPLHLPSVADFMERNPVVHSAYEAQILGASRATDAYASVEEQDPALRTALEAFKNGDETVLLPYQPTPSINPPRPRTLAAGYDAHTQTLRVKFRDGAVYEYHDVPPRVWRNFKRWKSPGRGINRVLNNYDYNRLDIS